ncbi:MAG TPA: hypothetical protein VM286_06305 [Candidatus Thermoplasmatota archaeon]|nr:hypothetical protein [Candidatus Thermoplasmatota archaeon]
MRALLPCLLLLALLAGCFSPGANPANGTGTDTTAPQAPGPKVATDVKGLQLVASVRNSTLGEWVEDGLAYLSSGSDGLRIVDVRDPANPIVLAKDIPDSESRDVDLIHHPNGHLYALLADSSEDGTKLFDVTNPQSVTFVAKTPVCDHTVAVVPGTTVVYASWSLCQAFNPSQMQQGDTEILDFKDPEHPVSKMFVFPPVAMTAGGPKPITATSCHEMTFNAQLHRAYCAAISDTQVWDTTDPLNPVIVAVIDDPLVNIHHSVWDADNGTTLIIGDEFTGVILPTPACTDKAQLPTSALAFYDVRDLAAPKRVGYYNIPYDAVAGSGESGRPQYCSTHLGDVIDGTHLIVMGWYSAGTVMVDFTDPAHAKTVATWRATGESSVWETRYMDGHVYASDEVRGLDILDIVRG